METKKSKAKRVLEQDLQSYRVEVSELSQIHHSYEQEELFIKALVAGDRNKVYELVGEFLGIPLLEGDLDFQLMTKHLIAETGILSRSEEKQVEYFAVTMIVLASRAAIRSGVDPFRSYDISNLFLQRLSEATDAVTYWSLMIEVIDTYLQEIQAVHSSEVRSIHVLHAKQYIGRNLNQPLSLELIAEELGLSEGHLSKIFKQTEGIGLKQYIVEQRIEAAKNLLMYSNADIGTIASYVGFCSQSYFGKVFRQHTGTTPLAFRISMQK